MRQLLIILFAGLMLGGCATRGALNIDCRQFGRAVTNPPPIGIVADVQREADHLQRELQFVAGTSEGPTAIERGVDRAIASTSRVSNTATRSIVDEAPATDILMLSGGGQWGAFGAGFMAMLSRRPEHMPRPALITGVSTGALQAFFLALQDADRFERLSRQYSPASEDEIVTRNPMWAAVITGSMAGLAPLKRRIEEELCNNGNPEDGCPMIRALARPDGPDVLVGFVEATSGEFVYADLRRLAQLAAALASAAMPVFFQQVTINNIAYYDGGVRQSVFEREVASRLRTSVMRSVRAEVARQRFAGRAPTEGDVAALVQQTTQRLFVIRNGPTIAEPADAPDPGPLPNALRAEAILVNENEVNSVAELRLIYPFETLNFISADGYRNSAGCQKEGGGVMFDPVFMQCLLRFGGTRASETPPWRQVRPIESMEREMRMMPGRD